MLSCAGDGQRMFVGHMIEGSEPKTHLKFDCTLRARRSLPMRFALLASAFASIW